MFRAFVVVFKYIRFVLLMGFWFESLESVYFKHNDFRVDYVSEQITNPSNTIPKSDWDFP
mgnify:CR=1 FL=1